MSPGPADLRAVGLRRVIAAVTTAVLLGAFMVGALAAWVGFVAISVRLARAFGWL